MTEDQLAVLADRFYAKVRDDDVLGHSVEPVAEMRMQVEFYDRQPKVVQT